MLSDVHGGKVRILNDGEKEDWQSTYIDERIAF